MKKAKRIIILCCVIAILSSLISASALAANLSDSSVSVGDTITFGSYEQDNNSANGTETIEWQVLDVQDGKALIISKYVLDSQSYNPERVAMTWEECNLRKWLNDEFLNAAFTAAEQEQIISTTIQNPNNSSYGTDGGNDTTDHIFLLNIEESLNYFPSNDERVVKPT